MLKNMSYKVETTDLKQVIHTSDYANKSKLTNVVGKSVFLIIFSSAINGLSHGRDQRKRNNRRFSPVIKTFDSR